jgi:hypothetical protein
VSKKTLPDDYETFEMTNAPIIAIRECDLRASGWIREKEAANVLSDENVVLRSVLGRLLELDASRPVDPTWWRPHWEEVLTEAKKLLGGTYPRKTPVQP